MSKILKMLCIVLEVSHLLELLMLLLLLNIKGYTEYHSLSSRKINPYKDTSQIIYKHLGE